jgi:MFS family permease
MIAVLRHRELRALLIATLVSTAGDQLARVALMVLVYERTGSALMSGMTYASTFLPALIGAPLLGGLADRRPRRRVMITADLIRVVLLCGLAVPGIPVPLALALVVLVTLVECPFDAARAALLPAVSPELYVHSLAIDRAVQQSAQVVGFAAGGLVLVVLNPSTALLLDSLTFAVSALLVARWVAPRPAVMPEPFGTLRSTVLSDLRNAFRVVLADRLTRRPVLFVWLACAVACVPEGLAAPYASSLGRGAGTVALIMAANPVGNTVAGLLLARTSAALQPRLLGPLAVLVSLPLAVCLLRPAVPVLVPLVALSGAGMALSLLARAQFVARIPDAERGRAFALAAAGITVAQGGAVAVTAALAEATSPAVVVGMAGVAGLVAALALRLTHPTPDPVRRTAATPALVTLPAPHEGQFVTSTSN